MPMEGLSDDIKAAVLVGPEGPKDRLGELTVQLLEKAGTDQVEVSTGTAIVYALRQGERALGVVTSRFALSSLMFTDMRAELEGRL
jgi:hypothetical protein